MWRIVAVVASEDERRRVAEQLAGASVRYCETVAALEALAGAGGAGAGGIDAVVTGLRDAAGAPVAPAVVALQAHVPGLRVLFHAALSRGGARELVAAAGSGVRAEYALLPFERLDAAVERLLAPHTPSAGGTLVTRLAGDVPAGVRPYVTVCALRATPRLRVRTAAAWSRVSVRTLERRLRRAHLPAASFVLRASAGLHAAWLLDVHDWPAKRVVAEMRFSHASALTRLMRRYCGCTPSTLREEGGFDAALDRVASAFRASA